jgi:hypothetical protein
VLRSCLVILAVGLVAACGAACGNLSPSSDQDPCTQLGLVCDQCKQAVNKQNCQNALAAADDAQCAAVLDQRGFQSDCVATDAGTDATPVEAAALPVCGDQASPDAGCACSGSEGGTCTPSCPAGGCRITCEPGAVCEGSCAGGDCTFDCRAGSQCANTCAGGGCTFQCELDAVCNDSCSATGKCVGM